MSGGGKQTSTTVNKTEIPEWLDKAGQENYNRAKDIANKPADFYGGPRVAPLSETTTNAFNYLKTNQNAGTDLTDQAAGIFSGIAGLPTGFTPVNSGQVSAGADVVAGQLKDTDLSSYMNPYISNVIDTSLGALDRSRTMALQQNADKAISAGAFGGSRSAIVDAVTNAETAREAGILSSGLYRDAYDKAVSGATGDINRRLSTDIYNRDTRLGVDTGNVNRDLAAASTNQAAQLESQRQAAQNAATAGQGMLGAGNQKQQQILDMFGAQTGVGALEQAQRQSEINAEREKFDEPRKRELENLNLLLSSLGMTPYGQTTTQTSTTPTPGTDWGTLGMGIFSTLMGLSDDDWKEDKVKVGETDDGLGIWSFRYKGDPKTYPKSIGVMASEVEKVKPEAVKRIPGGPRVVDYGLLAGGI